MKATILRQFLMTTVYILVSLFSVQGFSHELPSPKELLAETFLEIEKMGVHHIGGKSIGQILSEIDSVTINFVPELVFQNMQNTREGVRRGSGYWNRSTKQIFLSEKHMIRMTPTYGRWVLMHEVIEYLDLGDANLHQSALMDAVTSLQRIDDRYRNQKAKPFLKSTETLQVAINEINYARGGGGVSVVDGGGDGRILGYMKMIYMEVLTRIDSGSLTAAQFQKIFSLLRSLDVEFMETLPQGKYVFNSQKKILRIPTEPTVGTNYDLNEVGVFHLVNEMQKVTPKL